jgi:hypothetical protein
MGAAALSMINMQTMLNINQGGSTMYQRACQQYLTLLLNLASNKVGQYTLASSNGVTHSQAVVYINQIIATNPTLAKNIAETLNNAQMVANGVIDPNTPNIIFGVGEAQTMAQIYTFKIDAPSPNPFNASTTIKYALPEVSMVNLAIYDVTGRLVAQLVNGMTAVGTHNVTFDGSSLPSGLYIYRLTAGQNSAAGKMVLLK